MRIDRIKSVRYWNLLLTQQTKEKRPTKGAQTNHTQYDNIK